MEGTGIMAIIDELQRVCPLWQDVCLRSEDISSMMGHLTDMVSNMEIGIRNTTVSPVAPRNTTISPVAPRNSSSTIVSHVSEVRAFLSWYMTKEMVPIMDLRNTPEWQPRRYDCRAIVSWIYGRYDCISWYHGRYDCISYSRLSSTS